MMALSKDTLSGMIEQNLPKDEKNLAKNRKKFCDAVAAGIVMTIVGKPFMTMDTGTIPGVGQGTGTGIQGLMYDNMSQLALAAMPTRGENAKKLMDAIMKATCDHLKQSASLQSVHTPVFLGVGQVIHIASVLQPEMMNNIDQQLQGKGANGENRMPLALAIATGICTDILMNSTGQVIIVGSPTAPTPVPGAGSGTGVIS